MFMTYLDSVIRFPDSSVSLVSAIKLKCNDNFRSSVVVVVTFY